MLLKHQFLGRKIVSFLAVTSVVLVMISVFGKLVTLYVEDFFGRDFLAVLLDLNEEGSVPTVFSAAGLLLCSVLFGIIAVGKRREGAPFSKHWIALSVILFLMSAEEGFVQLHERSERLLRQFIDPHGLTHFVWVVPGIVFVAVFAVVFFRFLLHLPARPRRMFVIAGGTYVTGALGCEMIGGYLSGPHWSAGNLTLFDHLIMTIEEGLEMSGIVLLVYALLLQIASSWEEVTIELKLVKPDPGHSADEGQNV